MCKLKTYNPIPNLLTLALVPTIGKIISRIYGHIPITRRDTEFDETTFMFKKEAEVKKSIEKLELPQCLIEELISYSQVMCCELNSWISSPIMYGLERYLLVDQIVWTQLGRIDEEETFLCNLHSMTETERIVRACRLYLEEFLRAAWKVEYNQMSFSTFDDDYNLKFWKRYFRQRPPSNTQYAFYYRYSVQHGNYYAGRYFMNLMDRESFEQTFRIGQVESLSPVKQGEFLVKALKKISDQTYKQQLSTFKFDMLNCLSYLWPQQREMFICLEDLLEWRHLTTADVQHLSHLIRRPLPRLMKSIRCPQLLAELKVWFNTKVKKLKEEEERINTRALSPRSSHGFNS